MLTKIIHVLIPSSTTIGALIDTDASMHPINAFALISGAFASICIGLYHIKRKK